MDSWIWPTDSGPNTRGIVSHLLICKCEENAIAAEMIFCAAFVWLCACKSLWVSERAWECEWTMTHCTALNDTKRHINSQVKLNLMKCDTLSAVFMLLCFTGQPVLSFSCIICKRRQKKDRLDNKRMLEKKHPVVSTCLWTILCGLITTGLRYRIFIRLTFVPQAKLVLSLSCVTGLLSWALYDIHFP